MGHSSEWDARDTREAVRPVSETLNFEKALPLTREREAVILSHGRPFFTFTVNGLAYRVFFRHKRFDDSLEGEHAYEVTMTSYKDHAPWLSHSEAKREYPRRAYTKCLIMPEVWNGYCWLGKIECSWSDKFSRAAGRHFSLAKAIDKMLTIEVRKARLDQLLALIVTSDKGTDRPHKIFLED